MKRNALVIILLLMLAPLFTMNCSRDDTAIVRIQLVNVPEGAAQSSNFVFERVFRWFVPSAWAFEPWPFPDTDLQVVLSSPDLFDITFYLPIGQSSITLEVPSGPKRRITVYGYNASNKVWGGHVEIDLNPGDEKQVVINMLPVVGMPTVMNEGTARVLWGQISDQEGLFGIVGYRIFRSDTGPEGPFNPVGTEYGIMAGMYEDSTVEVGRTYYYSVSVITDVLVGELSDPSLPYLH